MEANVNFVGERPVNRAGCGGFHQFGALLGCKRTRQLNRNLDPINHSIFGEAFFTVVRVDARVR